VEQHGGGRRVFGSAGEWPFIAAALLFTAATLFYSLKGGLRSSIATDVIQAALFVVVLAAVLFLVLPQHGAGKLLSAGDFRLDAGLDLVLVALLQALSYPFHDPVLTDRGFITEEKSMLRAMIVAGIAGFVCIFAFSLVGVHARLEGLPAGDNMPGAVARAFGLLPYLLMTGIMIMAAGSTLDSTFASIAKSVGQEVPLLAGRQPGRHAVGIGLWAMVAFSLLGNLPMIAGTDILKATTISGTMVMGLAPVFLLAPLVSYSPWSFHLAFWPGVVLATLLAAGSIPPSWAIGSGKVRAASRRQSLWSRHLLCRFPGPASLATAPAIALDIIKPALLARRVLPAFRLGKLGQREPKPC
jgi:SSS family solute:Na+ symporter